MGILQLRETPVGDSPSGNSRIGESAAIKLEVAAFEIAEPVNVHLHRPFSLRPTRLLIIGIISFSPFRAPEELKSSSVVEPWNLGSTCL